VTTFVRSSEMFHSGCSVTWDAEARAAYAHTRPSPDAFSSARTVELSDRLSVDVDDEGFVRGVEVLGRQIIIGDLLTVLGRCQIKETP
jgi:uncharacterized protein YuzE